MAGSGGNSINDVVPNEKFRDLSGKIRGEWKEIAGYLTLTDGTVYQIELDNRAGKEQIYQMLVTWKQKKGKNATYGVLSKALRQADRGDLADSLNCDPERDGSTPEVVTKVPGTNLPEPNNRLLKEKAFRAVLAKMAKKLTKDDVHTLRFQCPEISPADRNLIDNGFQLFDEMERCGILTVERLEELMSEKQHLNEMLEDFKRRYD